jgi:hypothetical protein
MLKPAILYKEAIPAYFAKASMDPANRFVRDSYWGFDDLVSNTQWHNLDFVSVDTSDNLIGILSVSINRQSHYAHDLMALRFEKGDQYAGTWAKDFKEFFVLLFGYYRFQKLNFTVCVGSPHEAMYNRFCDKYGGRVVGIKKRDFRLIDGEIVDTKIYEILREDFISAVGKKKWEKYSMSKVTLPTPKEREEN